MWWNHKIETLEPPAEPPQDLAANEMDATAIAKRSVAEVAAHLLELLDQSGHFTAEALRPLLALLPADHYVQIGMPVENQVSDGGESAEGLQSTPNSSLGYAEVDGAQPASARLLADAGETTVAASNAGKIDSMTLNDREELPTDRCSTRSTGGHHQASPKKRLEGVPVPGMAEIIEGATRTLSILKLKLSSVTALTRHDEGWIVTAELVERAGVPDTSDILGVYEVQLDALGKVVSYERTRLRRRCDLSW